MSAPDDEEEEEKRKKRLPRASSLPRSVSGCRLGSTRHLFFFLGDDFYVHEEAPENLDIFVNEPLVCGSHFAGVLASVHGGIWRNFTHFLRPLFRRTSRCARSIVWHEA